MKSKLLPLATLVAGLASAFGPSAGALSSTGTASPGVVIPDNNLSGVPDGGATLTLLATALAGLLGLRCKLSGWSQPSCW